MLFIHTTALKEFPHVWYYIIDIWYYPHTSVHRMTHTHIISTTHTHVIKSRGWWKLDVEKKTYYIQTKIMSEIRMCENLNKLKTAEVGLLQF